MDEHRSERFGRYEILSELGRGAMGIVYKARDPRINRIVAVKTISLAGQPAEEERDFRQRFLREAEAAGRLSHPGIVTVFDAGEEAETQTPYIVMEFVGGQSLDKVLLASERKLPAERALQLALELAEALDYAHSQGVVHRDLKPENIVLTEDGHAKIADFGVAKLNLGNQTLAGRALGTPAYMSPEQLNGDPVDGRSDLFSLGVILYTILTGYRPFQGNSAITISYRVVNHEPIPATILDTELPPGLDHIITRAMAKNPAERYQRGMEMVLDIQHLRGERAPYSKAKHGDALIGREAFQKAKVAPLSPTPGQDRLQIGAHGSSNLSQASAGNAAIENFKEKLRRKSYIGALLLGGFLALAIWDVTLGPKGISPKAAGPFPRRPTIGAGNAEVSSAATGVSPAGPDSSEIAPEPTRITVAPARVVARPETPTARSAKPATINKTPLQTAYVARTYSAPKITADIKSPAVSAAPSAAPLPSTLEIEVDHKFAEAHLSIWVDDTLSYTHVLVGADKKRLGVFHHVEGHEFHAMQIATGKHSLRVRVTSAATANLPAFDKSDTIVGEFNGEKDNVLRIDFDKHGEMIVALQ
jgi:serine/threonine protein kinase